MGAKERTQESEEEKRGWRLRQRLRGVRKRKRAQRGFKCEVVALKMRLVKLEGGRDR
jgi:hypothetical protein